jgi:hypothetical protein
MSAAKTRAGTCHDRNPSVKSKLHASYSFSGFKETLSELRSKSPVVCHHAGDGSV